MKTKRFKKILMAEGFSRNQSNWISENIRAVVVHEDGTHEKLSKLDLLYMLFDSIDTVKGAKDAPQILFDILKNMANKKESTEATIRRECNENIMRFN